MATWTGWVAQFLSAASILNTPPNQRFLTAWASHAQAQSCHNNPIDLSEKATGSTNCVKPAGDFPWIQAYTSHASAGRAFNRQIHTTFASSVLAALDSGNPFQFTDWQDVVGQLRQWGSGRFADWYLAQMQGGSGGSGGGTSVGPNTHKAWTDLQRAINIVTPKELGQSKRLRKQTLRDIGKARKVKH